MKYRKGKAKKIRKQTACQVVVSLLLCSGLMFVLDGALPMIFGDLTSGTAPPRDTHRGGHGTASGERETVDGRAAQSGSMEPVKPSTVMVVTRWFQVSSASLPRGQP